MNSATQMIHQEYGRRGLAIFESKPTYMIGLRNAPERQPAFGVYLTDGDGSPLAKISEGDMGFYLRGLWSGLSNMNNPSGWFETLEHAQAWLAGLLEEFLSGGWRLANETSTA